MPIGPAKWTQSAITHVPPMAGTVMRAVAERACEDGSDAPSVGMGRLTGVNAAIQLPLGIFAGLIVCFRFGPGMGALPPSSACHRRWPAPGRAGPLGDKAVRRS